MVLEIPSGVLSKYYEVIDATIDNMFGVDCVLIHIETTEVISNTYDNIPQYNSITAHMRGGPTQYKRENKTIQEVETTENLKMKVYYDAKNFTKRSKAIDLPDGTIQTIFYASDLHKIKKCKAMIPHTGIQELQETRYGLAGEPFPMGIGLTRYYGAFWTRI